MLKTARLALESGRDAAVYRAWFRAHSQPINSVLAWYNESVPNQTLSPLFCNCLQALQELKIEQVFGFS